MRKEQFDITGMTCSACASRVEGCVVKLPGVKDVSVNLLKNSMAVSYDESEMNTARIVEAVENSGYGAIPKVVAHNKKEAKQEVITAQAEYKEMKRRLILSALKNVRRCSCVGGHIIIFQLIFPAFLCRQFLQYHGIV
ncbi:MAG: cation-translocating P-type ATPase [Ruminococcaceae bacterium]|nr:cation-translocating P-type ATPase [Oscillospiraceae bacterium]